MLHYIRNDSCRFRTFVANRLRLIHSLSSPEQWRHVPSQLNPADIAALWFDRPQFLRESEINWLRQPDLRQPLATDDPEVKKKTTICAAVESSPVNYLHGLLLRCSAYKAIQRCTAWLLRFKQYWRWNYSSNKMPPRKSLLTADDLQDATLAIVQLVQWEAFAEAMSELPSVTNCTDIDKMLSEEKLRSVPNLQQFKHLSPFVLNGIMRMDGRLQNSNLPVESKHPMIMPTKHPVTDMLIRLYHEREKVTVGRHMC